MNANPNRREKNQSLSRTGKSFCGVSPSAWCPAIILFHFFLDSLSVNRFALLDLFWRDGLGSGSATRSTETNQRDANSHYSNTLHNQPFDETATHLFT